MPHADLRLQLQPHHALRADAPASRRAARVELDAPLGAGVPSARDRSRLAVRLTETGRQLVTLGRTLAPAQWTARPAAGGWNAVEVVEHLALAEWSVLAFVRDALSGGDRAAGPLPAAAVGREAPLPRLTDDALWHRVAGRRVRLHAPERLRPTGRWARPAAQLAAFQAERAATLAYLRTTTDPLRAVFAPHPNFGLLDGCQWLLYLAAHTERHLGQLAHLARAAAA